LFDEAPANVLAGLLSERTLLAFDFDGTLAPIVNDRSSASMLPATLSRFCRVCELYSCAVITGRSRKDLINRLGSARVWRFVGNHGLETDSTKSLRRPEMAEAACYLSQALAGMAGIELEDKGLSLAIHFRRAPVQQLALDAIQTALTNLPHPMRRVDGKAVVNLVPAEAPHKGDALVALRRESGATRALYVGDDVTDEDVFELKQPSWLVTVRVGSSVNSEAAYYLRDQSEIDRLLDELVRLAEAGPRK
jgi:trehalose 6-phosphate phosphatase